MTVIGSTTDAEALTVTFVAEFDAPPSRVWQVWEDPRQLERWWGPPTWPSTFDRHEFTPGGQCRYHMTGPQGEKAFGWWTIVDTDAPNRLVVEEGLSGTDGDPDLQMPTMRLIVTFETIGSGGRTRMTIVTQFEDLEQLEKVTAMRMVEGMIGALGQIDAILA